MTEETFLTAKGWSATAVRTSGVLVLLALVLIVIAASASDAAGGLAVIGAVVLGAGVLVGIAGAVGSLFRR